MISSNDTKPIVDTSFIQRIASGERDYGVHRAYDEIQAERAVAVRRPTTARPTSASTQQAGAGASFLHGLTRGSMLVPDAVSDVDNAQGNWRNAGILAGAVGEGFGAGSLILRGLGWLAKGVKGALAARWATGALRAGGLTPELTAVAGRGGAQRAANMVALGAATEAPLQAVGAAYGDITPGQAALGTAFAGGVGGALSGLATGVGKTAIGARLLERMTKDAALERYAGPYQGEAGISYTARDHFHTVDRLADAMRQDVARSTAAVVQPLARMPQELPKFQELLSADLTLRRSGADAMDEATARVEELRASLSPEAREAFGAFQTQLAERREALVQLGMAEEAFGQMETHLLTRALGGAKTPEEFGRRWAQVMETEHTALIREMTRQEFAQNPALHRLADEPNFTPEELAALRAGQGIVKDGEEWVMAATEEIGAASERIGRAISRAEETGAINWVEIGQRRGTADGAATFAPTLPGEIAWPSLGRHPKMIYYKNQLAHLQELSRTDPARANELLDEWFVVTAARRERGSGAEWMTEELKQWGARLREIIRKRMAGEDIGGRVAPERLRPAAAAAPVEGAVERPIVTQMPRPKPGAQVNLTQELEDPSVVAARILAEEQEAVVARMAAEIADASDTRFSSETIGTARSLFAAEDVAGLQQAIEASNSPAQKELFSRLLGRLGGVPHAEPVVTMTVSASEKVTAAATRMRDNGEVFTGFNHAESRAAAHTARGGEVDYYGGYTSIFEDADVEEGFVTSLGRFVSREEASELAKRATQFRENVPDAGRLDSANLSREEVAAPPIAVAPSFRPLTAQQIKDVAAASDFELKGNPTQIARGIMEIGKMDPERLLGAYNSAQGTRKVFYGSLYEAVTGQRPPQRVATPKIVRTEGRGDPPAARPKRAADSLPINSEALYGMPRNAEVGDPTKARGAGIEQDGGVRGADAPKVRFTTEVIRDRAGVKTGHRFFLAYEEAEKLAREVWERFGRGTREVQYVGSVGGERKILSLRFDGRAAVRTPRIEISETFLRAQLNNAELDAVSAAFWRKVLREFGKRGNVDGPRFGKRGVAAPEVASVLAGSAAGAVTGAAVNDEDPLAGAVGGGLLGAAGGATLARMLGRARDLPKGTTENLVPPVAAAQAVEAVVDVPAHARRVALPRVIEERIRQIGVTPAKPAIMRDVNRLTGIWASGALFWNGAAFFTKQLLSDPVMFARSVPGMFVPGAKNPLAEMLRVIYARHRTPQMSIQQAGEAIAGAVLGAGLATADGQVSPYEVVGKAGLFGILGYGRGTYALRGTAPVDVARLAQYEEMRRLGVINSGYMGSEIGMFEAGRSSGGLKDTVLALLSGRPTDGAPGFLRRALSAVGTIQTERENWMRGAAYLHLRQRGIAEPIAAKGAREIAVDYTKFSDFENTYLRGFLMPFYSFTRHNVPNWYKAAIGRDVGGGGRAAQAALVGIAAFDTAAQVWNETFFPDIERVLSDEQRKRFHIIVGNPTTGEALLDDKGNPLVFAPDMPYEVALEMFGLARPGVVFSNLFGMPIHEEDSLAARWQRAEEASVLHPKGRVMHAVEGMTEVFRGLASPVIRLGSEYATGEHWQFGNYIVPYQARTNDAEWAGYWEHTARTLLPIYNRVWVGGQKVAETGFDPWRSAVGLGVPFDRGTDRDMMLKRWFFDLMDEAAGGEMPERGTRTKLRDMQMNISDPAVMYEVLSEELRRMPSAEERARAQVYFGRLVARRKDLRASLDALSMAERAEFFSRLGEADKKALVFYLNAPSGSRIFGPPE